MKVKKDFWTVVLDVVKYAIVAVLGYLTSSCGIL